MLVKPPAFSRSKGDLGKNDIVAREVADPYSFRVGEDDVSEVPFVGQMSVPDRDAHGQDLADRFRVDDEVFVPLARRWKVVILVFFQMVIQALWSGSSTSTCMGGAYQGIIQWMEICSFYLNVIRQWRRQPKKVGVRTMFFASEQ